MRVLWKIQKIIEENQNIPGFFLTGKTPLEKIIKNIFDREGFKDMLDDEFGTDIPIEKMKSIQCVIDFIVSASSSVDRYLSAGYKPNGGSYVENNNSVGSD